MMGERYILNDEGEPESCEDLIQWAQWFERANRTVARDKTADGQVSTVFLGLDHSFGEGPPLLYETMVFGGSMDQEMQRYTTRKQAVAGHKRTFAAVKEAEGL